VSGVVRALRRQLMRAHEQMHQVDAAIAALGSLNVIRRSQELTDRRKIAAFTGHELGENGRNLSEEETIQ
jgi:hypothetical protein